jgi:hypothetical protein
MFMDSFDLFPICAIVNGKFIALHGGLSPLLQTVRFSPQPYSLYSLRILTSSIDSRSLLDKDCSAIFSGRILWIMIKGSRMELIRTMRLGDVHMFLGTLIYLVYI